MWIIKAARVRQYWELHPSAKKALQLWLRDAGKAAWKLPSDVKEVYGARVDFVKVASGNTVSVFDIANNNFRLIAAIHYNTGKLFVLRFLTHKEYDTEKWKAEL